MTMLSCLKRNIETDRTAGTEYLVEQGAPNNKSLLSFFAINALELSAPASPVLLEHNAPAIPSGWLQLSGHPRSIAPAANGSVRKRISGPDDAEVAAYRKLSVDSHAAKVVPKFLGVHRHDGEHFIELQDLLHGFHDPNVMDIKIGCRTFTETEVSNTTLREDLYSKMVAIDPSAPTPEEHAQKSITKLRYMMFRENMSSSSKKGFRIEALKMRGSSPVTDMKTVSTGQEIQTTIENFVNARKSVVKDITKRLKQMRTLMEKSEFFQRHQVVGSSIFIVYDDHKVGVWLIDFAKALPLPEGVTIDHRRRWALGNCEEGLLFGMDELIRTMDDVYRSLQQSSHASKRTRRR